jgi:superfamily II DNA or RNA helicase
MIIVSTKDLRKQWVEEIQAMFKNATVSEYHRGKPLMMADFVIGIINSCSSAYTNRFRNKFRCTIFDEADTFCTPMFSQVFYNCSSKYHIGLTATIKRDDNFDSLLRTFIGCVIDPEIHIKGFSGYSDKFDGNIHIIHYIGEYKYTRVEYIGGVPNVNKTIELGIMKDPKRLLMICQLLKKLYKRNRKIYVFSIYRKNSELMMNKLKEMGVDDFCDEETMIKLMGGATDEERALAKSKMNSKIIFTTYSYCTRGISIKEMDTLVFAQPRKKGVTQSIGRIIRLGGDTSIKREIYDIVDQNKYVFQNQLKHRVKFYAKTDFTSDSEIINYNNIKDD